MKRAAPLLAGALLTACGLVIGIDPDLGVKPGPDAGPDVVVEASVPPPEVRDAAADVVRAWPKEGTYVFRQSEAGAGFDELVGLAKSNYAVGSVTVRWKAGLSCFDVILEPRDAYADTFSFCVSDDELVQLSGKRSQTFQTAFGKVGATTYTTCLPGDVYFSYAAPADGGWLHDCTGFSTAANVDSGFETKGPYLLVGDESLRILDADVPTRHYRASLRVTGAQDGNNDNDWWFALADGTLVRFARHVDLSYQAAPPPFGPVRYREEVDMSLVGLPDAGTD